MLLSRMQTSYCRAHCPSVPIGRQRDDCDLATSKIRYTCTVTTVCAGGRESLFYDERLAVRHVVGVQDSLPPYAPGLLENAVPRFHRLARKVYVNVFGHDVFVQNHRG